MEARSVMQVGEENVLCDTPGLKFRSEGRDKRRAKIISGREKKKTRGAGPAFLLLCPEKIFIFDIVSMQTMPIFWGAEAHESLEGCCLVHTGCIVAKTPTQTNRRVFVLRLKL